MALRLLKERAILLRQAAARAAAAGQVDSAERLDEQATVADRYVEVLQRDLLAAEPGPPSNAVVEEDLPDVERDGPSQQRGDRGR